MSVSLLVRLQLDSECQSPKTISISDNCANRIFDLAIAMGQMDVPHTRECKEVALQMSLLNVRDRTNLNDPSLHRLIANDRYLGRRTILGLVKLCAVDPTRQPRCIRELLLSSVSFNKLFRQFLEGLYRGDTKPQCMYFT